jgi:hypothetical protein
MRAFLEVSDTLDSSCWWWVDGLGSLKIRYLLSRIKEARRACLRLAALCSPVSDR